MFICLLLILVMAVPICISIMGEHMPLFERNFGIIGVPGAFLFLIVRIITKFPKLDTYLSHKMDKYSPSESNWNFAHACVDEIRSNEMKADSAASMQWEDLTNFRNLSKFLRGSRHD